MASVRKKYAGFLESRRSNDGPPVASTPTGGAELPPAVEAKPIEIEPVESPAELAAKSAIQQRLEETKRAEALQREAPSQQSRFADEPPQQPQMPEAVQKWLTAHPQYLDTNDPIAQKELELASMKTVRGGLTWDQPDFLPTLERHLGLAAPQQAPQTPMKPQQVTRQPVRQSGAPVSAPPSRDSLSYSTGRSVSRPIELTAEERDLARTLGLSAEQYAEGKKRMVALKQAGVIVDGR